MSPVFRFAPSPTGYLHLGHALSAQAVWRAAEDAGGTVLLRIEDIDPTRSRPEFSDAIVEDLEWLGFKWTGAIRRQSEHLSDYAAALDRLRARDLLYASKLTRKDVADAVMRAEAASGLAWPRDPDGAPRQPIPDARESDDRPALRLDMARAIALAGLEPIVWTENGAGPSGETGRILADPAAWGDVALARKETPTSYHLAVTVDDALQGVTHVVRGQDLFHATSVHRLLQRLLGLPEPTYAHHRLIADEDGQKLSKSRGSPSIRSLRADGWTSNDVLRAVDAFLR